MRKLLEQLENNTERLEQIDVRHEDIKTSAFYNLFGRYNQQKAELKKKY